MSSHARRHTTGLDVIGSFGRAFTRWGIPAGVLSDNGAVVTAKRRGDGRDGLEIELASSG